MSAAVIMRVAAAISMGAVLVGKDHSVGPYRRATDDDGVKFATLDLPGNVIDAWEQWDEADFSRGRYFPEKDTRYATDWSAFGAARAFVQVAGEASALAALEDLESGRNGRAIGYDRRDTATSA